MSAAPWGARLDRLFLANRARYCWKHDVPLEAPPPFWQTPLRDAHVKPQVESYWEAFARRGYKDP